MSLDFNRLKTAIRDIQNKFPKSIDVLDKDKNELAQEFLRCVSEMTDDEAMKLQPDTILLYNHMVQNPQDCVDPTEVPPVTVKKEEQVSRKVTTPNRQPTKKGTSSQNAFARFEGEVSSTSRIVMLTCDNPSLTCKQIYDILENEGYKTSRQTVNIQYGQVRSVLAYLAYTGRIENFCVPTNLEE